MRRGFVGHKVDQFSNWTITFFEVTGSTTDGPHDAVLIGATDTLGHDGKAVQAQDLESFGPPGIVFRPLPAEDVTLPDGTQGKLGVQGYGVRLADSVVPLAWRDLRLNRAFPNPKPGDLAFVGYGANFIKLGADGRISFCTTTDATPDGQLVQLQVKPDGFQLTGPFGKITYGQNGFHLLHYTGAKIDLGGIGGLPPPIDQLGTYATITAAIAKIKASAIVLGPDGGAADNVAKATALLTALTAIQAALVALLAAIPPGPGQAAALAAAGTAITASGAALTAGTTAIPSQSTSVT